MEFVSSDRYRVAGSMSVAALQTKTAVNCIANVGVASGKCTRADDRFGTVGRHALVVAVQVPGSAHRIRVPVFTASLRVTL